MITRKGIAAIIFFKERGTKKYLLMKRKLYWTGWEWLKGGIMDKESELFCLEREIKEETGKKADEYNVKSTGIVHKFIYQRPFVHDGVLWRGAENKVFVVEFFNPKIKLDNNEHSGYKWVGKKEALKMITYPDQLKIFKKLA